VYFQNALGEIHKSSHRDRVWTYSNSALFTAINWSEGREVSYQLFIVEQLSARATIHRFGFTASLRITISRSGARPKIGVISTKAR
jgi:hypothetical protein